MTKKPSFYFLIFLLILLLLPVSIIWARMESTHYIIWADVFSSGGTEDSTSTLYSLQDTIAEAMILSVTSTATLYGIKAGFREMYPDQYISLSIPADEANINLGTLRESRAVFATHTMIVDTNAVKGFTITVTGNSLTRSGGGSEVDAIGASAQASNPGHEQFGINLVDNASPDVGADASGIAPIGSAATNYDTADRFALNSGDTVASASNDINPTTFTVSYLANICSTTTPGI
jgi:hypothetical protein